MAMRKASDLGRAYCLYSGDGFMVYTSKLYTLNTYSRSVELEF